MKRLMVCFALMLCLALPCSALAERIYLIPDSDTRLLTEAELLAWDHESLGYILNEIFARHGFVFDPNRQYYPYFNSMEWYTPNENSDNSKYCYSQLSNVEWQNERLVKRVRKKMVESGNLKGGGRSVWDYFSPGFDTLNGFDFITMNPNQTLAVYSAPTASAWRGANGKACMNTNGRIYAAGWDSGWLLVMYETNYSAVRVGYVDGSTIKGGAKVSKQLSFDYEPATIIKRCTLTDDPTRTNSSITVLEPNSAVTYLKTFYGDSPWAYVETTVNNQLARGFVPLSHLYLESETDNGEDGPDGNP